MQPLDLDTVSDFGEAEAWTLQDSASGRYVTVADPRYPGRRPIRFFMKEQDAQSLLDRLREVNPKVRDAAVRPVRVPLLRALRDIAADRTPGNADSFVVHSPNEVFDWLKAECVVPHDLPELPPEIERQIDFLFAAELQFRLASPVRLATTHGEQPVDLPMEWRHGRMPGTLRMNEHALETRAACRRAPIAQVRRAPTAHWAARTADAGGSRPSSTTRSPRQGGPHRC